MEATETYPLRALSVGEIFDRAITIYVRHLVPLTLIVMTLIVPWTVAQGYIFRDQAHGVAAAIQQIEHPDPKKSMPTGELPLVFLFSFAALLLAPIVNDAVAVGVANVYSSKVPSYAACFARVLPRLWPLIGTTLLEGAILLGLYVASVFTLTIVILIGVMFVNAFLPFAVVIFIISALLVLAVFAFFVGLFIAFGFATYATVLEDLGPASAVGSSFRRLFARSEFKKLLLMGLSFFALNFGVLMLSATIDAIVELVVSNQIVELSISAVISSMSTAFITVLLAVYYYDVRTRSEGLDLEVDLARLTSP
jgi:hypothetical protein